MCFIAPQIRDFSGTKYFLFCFGKKFFLIFFVRSRSVPAMSLNRRPHYFPQPQHREAACDTPANAWTTPAALSDAFALLASSRRPQLSVTPTSRSLAQLSDCSSTAFASSTQSQQAATRQTYPKAVSFGANREDPSTPAFCRDRYECFGHPNNTTET